VKKLLPSVIEVMFHCPRAQKTYVVVLIVHALATIYLCVVFQPGQASKESAPQQLSHVEYHEYRGPCSSCAVSRGSSPSDEPLFPQTP
jgi:hypothetical protein